MALSFRFNDSRLMSPSNAPGLTCVSLSLSSDSSRSERSSEKVDGEMNAIPL